MRRVLMFGLLALGGCLDPLAYPCTAVTQCIVDGKDGTCHSSGWCAYPDAGCPSGLRYGPAAGDGLADDCAAGESVGGSASATSSSSSSSDTGDGCGSCDTPPGPCFEDEGTCDVQTGMCSYEPAPMGRVCTDDDPCTREESCNANGECVPGETIVCDDPPLDSPCRANPGTCEEDGSCTYELLPAGSDCEDGNACTIGDTCTTMGACASGDICIAEDGCSTGVCMDGACMFTPVTDGVSCGLNPADRCCSGVCVDISSDPAHCGGCGAACQSDEACESVSETPECDPHPIATSGRCTCNGEDLDCPPGQLCRTLTPIANRCAPDANADCASDLFVDVQQCPNYCAYPS